jgi:uncharacterized protein (DUF305 family)
MLNRRILLTSLLFAAAGCASAPSSAPPVLAAGSGVVGPGSAATIARADSVAASFTQAEVEFMTGMVPHHAQAIIMAQWCPTHGGRADLLPLCARIVASQKGEIQMMRGWLADRKQTVPDSMSTRHQMRMDGVVHDMMMPGMLTDEEMAALDRARGVEFDKLFLTGMIRHHQGAIQMVQDLWASPGGANEPTVFRFSNDVYADQSAEVLRMQAMLRTIPR